MDSPFTSGSEPALADRPQGLHALLRAGHFVVTAEMTLPDSADPADTLAHARLFDGAADAINVTDSPGARAHMSSLAGSALLVGAGYAPIMQITCRDRNRIAIQGDILGAAALGIEAILCLTGDGIQSGDHPDAKAVFDVDGFKLLELARTMCERGTYLSGRELAPPPRILIGAPENPFASPLDERPQRLQARARAGAQFVQTQYCFDVDLLAKFMARVRDMGLDREVFIIVGVGPLASVKSARWMRGNIPGVQIPDSVIARLEQAEDQAQEGRYICVELMQRIRGIAGVAGVHVMAFRQERWVPELVRQSGVLGARRIAAARPGGAAAIP